MNTPISPNDESMNIFQIITPAHIAYFIAAGGGLTMSEIEIWTGYTELAIKLVSLVTAIVIFIDVVRRYRKNHTPKKGKD